ncbi:MAG: hypothetical protein R2848_07320 [Thermomicrobiales bacterium]
MSSRWSDISRDDLELELAALGARLDWSPTPDLAEPILAAQAAPTPLPRAHQRRRWLAAAALALLIVGALLAGSATVRTSVADFLGIDGVRIELGEPTDRAVQTAESGDTDLDAGFRTLASIRTDAASLRSTNPTRSICTCSKTATCSV